MGLCFSQDRGKLALEQFPALRPNHEQLQGWVRWLNVHGFERIGNFRDVAGAVPFAKIAVHGGELRKGLLYRTGAWTCATGVDIAKLRDELAVKTLVDLRSPARVPYEGAHGKAYGTYPPSPCAHRKEQSSRTAGECRRVPVELSLGMVTDAVKAANPKPRSLEESLTRHLVALLRSTEAQAKLLEVFELLVDRRNYPVAFGCSTGKDVTGVVAMLLQRALGASASLCLEDFMLSNLCAGCQVWAFKHAVFQFMADLEGYDVARHTELLQEHPYADVLRPLPTKLQLSFMSYQEAEPLLVFQSAAIELLEAIEAEGGAAAYLSAIGFGPERLSLVREILVGPAAPVAEGSQ